MSLSSQVGQLLRHASLFSAANFLKKGIGFLMIPVYTHYLSPSEYGTLEVIDVFLMVSAMLAGMGISRSIVRFYHSTEDSNEHAEIVSTALWIVMLLGVLTCVGFFFVDGEIASFLFKGSEGREVLYLNIVFITFVFQMLCTVPEGVLLAQKRSKEFSTINVITFFSYLTLNVLFVVGFEMGVLGMLVSTVITKIFNNVMLFSRTWRSFAWCVSTEKLMSMLKFGLPLVPASFAMMSIHYGDRVFIQMYAGSADLGVYSLGYKFGMILSVLISGPLFDIFNTLRFEIAAEDDAERQFKKIFTYIITLISFVAMGLVVFSSDAIRIMAPGEYQAASVVIFPIVLSYVFFGAHNFFTTGIFIGYKTKFLSISAIFTAVVNLLLNFLLVPQFGIIGAAYATLLTFVVLAMSTLWLSQRVYPMQFEVGRIVKLAAVFAVICGLSELVEGALWFTIGAKLLLLASFLPSLLLVGFFDSDEKAKARVVFRRALSGALGTKQPEAGA